MILRVFLTSGEHFDIPEADWKECFKSINSTIEAGRSSFMIHDERFPMFLDLDHLAAIVRLI